MSEQPQPRPEELAAQLRKPEGEFGLQVAQAMNRTNADMNRNCYGAVDVQDGHRVLEIGPGNGFFIRELLGVGPGVRYAAIDYSADMVALIERTHRSQITEGLVEVAVASVSEIPYPNDSFDRIVTVNTLYFWPEPSSDAKEVLRVLKPGGRLCLGIRPKNEAEQLPVTKFGFTLYTAEEAEALLKAAGFVNVRHELIADPPMEWQGQSYQLHTLCLIAEKAP